jgi:hypothetical protein
VGCVAPIVIVVTAAGGVLVADTFPEFAQRHALPGFSTPDDEASTATSNSQRSNNSRRAVPSAGATQLWQWSGASSGPVRTVMLAIDPQIYPVDGVRWYLNGAHDRNDIHGPLDAEYGLWHSSTHDLSAGDVVSACWIGRDGQERCPQTVVR